MHHNDPVSVDASKELRSAHNVNFAPDTLFDDDDINCNKWTNFDLIPDYNSFEKIGSTLEAPSASNHTESVSAFELHHDDLPNYIEYDRILTPASTSSGSEKEFEIAELKDHRTMIPSAGGDSLFSASASEQHAQHSDLQYVPVQPQGDHYFYNPEHPISSAATFNGFPVPQSSVNIADFHSSQPKSAHPTFATGSHFPQQHPNTFHGLSCHPSTFDFNVPLSAGGVPISHSGSHFAFQPTGIVQPSALQPSRSLSSLADHDTSPSKAHGPHTPSASPQYHSRTLQSHRSNTFTPQQQTPLAYRPNIGFGMPRSRAPSTNTEAEANVDEEMDYETERLQNIQRNQELMNQLGLGEDPNASQGRSKYSRSPSKSLGKRRSASNLKSHALKGSKASRQPSLGPIRASNRLASMDRRVSYADMDSGNDPRSGSTDSFGSADIVEEDEDDGWGEGGGRNRKYQRTASGRGASQTTGASGHEAGLRELLDQYPMIRETYPLFYHMLTPDMVINNDSIPLIGSIPTNCPLTEKADYLKGFFHKGKRCIAQLDAFTARCEKRYEGPGEKWKPLEYNMRIAIRDVRRKTVERTENYKYTRRDLLNKALGKDRWEPIEDDMIRWTPEEPPNLDPAGDLVGFVLESPPPRGPRAPPYVNQMEHCQHAPPQPSLQRRWPSSRRAMSGVQTRVVTRPYKQEEALNEGRPMDMMYEPSSSDSGYSNQPHLPPRHQQQWYQHSQQAYQVPQQQYPSSVYDSSSMHSHQGGGIPYAINTQITPAQGPGYPLTSAGNPATGPGYAFMGPPQQGLQAYGSGSQSAYPTTPGGQNRAASSTPYTPQGKQQQPQQQAPVTPSSRAGQDQDNLTSASSFQPPTPQQLQQMQHLQQQQQQQQQQQY